MQQPKKVPKSPIQVGSMRIVGFMGLICTHVGFRFPILAAYVSECTLINWCLILPEFVVNLF